MFSACADGGVLSKKHMALCLEQLSRDTPQVTDGHRATYLMI
jgi:hypothetical protein